MTLCGGVTRKPHFEKHYVVNDERSEFQKLCSLDVLGLEDVTQPEDFNHQTFKNHIKYCENGYYETAVLWKMDHPPLPCNKKLTKVRLLATTKRLEKMEKLEQYHEVMLDQINTGILELIPDELSGNQVHYIPHHAVFKENAETTKLRIVYDCSSKESNDVPSLNDCLETGPPLQPKLFDILVRNRFKRFITGDVQKAFLQIRIDDRD